mmetsp:Transcript_3661/g.5429  ORF Transcript_3661/g.5429 Transcript_3661/m.5429 type:complete len:226 (-) Transcript_3661:99-776(-)
MAENENTRQLIGAFLQEFGGSILMITLLFPFGSFLGDTWTGWVAHFFCVMLADYISVGSQVNPSVSIATYVYGWIPLNGMIVRLLGQVAASFIVFPLISMFTPSYVALGGPQLGEDMTITKGILYEAALTGGLLLIILMAATQVGLPAQRPIIAVGIRALIYVGAKTGPAMNPMIAFGWAWFTNTYFDRIHVIVYWIAPTVGAVVGVLIWKGIESLLAPTEGKKD